MGRSRRQDEDRQAEDSESRQRDGRRNGHHNRVER